MTISVDWPSKVIHVQKVDMSLIQLLPIEVRELNMEVLRLALKDLEDDELGQVWLDTHRHNAAVTVGGVTLAQVVEIINDYTITFENGTYLVNVFGANSNLADRVNPNNVSVRSANSAGLLQSREIEQAAFGGCVTLDTITGTPGTLYPQGTRLHPVNTLADAMLIDGVRGFQKFDVHGLIIILAGVNITDRYFYGGGLTLNEADAVIQFEAGCIAEDTWYSGCVIRGVQGGESQYHACRIENLSNAHCHYESCAMIGPITAPVTVPTVGHTKSMINCFSGVNEFIFDLNGSPLNQVWKAFTGRIRFNNGSNAAGIIRIDMAGGTITIDASCTATNFIVTGHCNVVNNSTANVDTSGVLPNNAGMTMIQKLLRNKTHTDPATGIMTVFDDDGVTVLYTAALKEDIAGVQQYRGQGANRRDRLA